DEKRTLRARAHEAHVTLQDVQDLRQLIDPKLAYDAPDRRRAVVVRVRPAGPSVALGIASHAAELEDREDAATLANSFLTIQDGPSVLEVDAQCRQQHDGQRQDHEHCARRHVEKALDRFAHESLAKALPENHPAHVERLEMQLASLALEEGGKIG